jgi:peroxiredoxin
MRHLTLTTTVFLASVALGCPSSGSSPSEGTGAKKSGAASQPGSSKRDAPKQDDMDHDHDHAEQGAGDALTIGATAPKIEREMKSVDGSMASVKSAAKEKGVLVIFTCNHCPWVKAWQERTVALANAFSERGVGVIAINSNDPAANAIDGMDGMQERAEALGMEYPYVVDEGSRMARAYGATKTPEFFLFDSDLELVYHGAIDDNAQKPEQVKKTYLHDALSALVEGQPITIAETKALGCGIKFRDPT